MFTVSLQPKALKHIEDTFNWYDKISLDLGYKFLIAVDLAIAVLENHPNYFFNETKVYRRIVINGFPYKMIYEIEDKKVYVVAVKHFSRDIDY